MMGTAATDNINEKEKRRIIEEDDVNLFVEAGAGAGKTHELVTRIVNRLTNKDDCMPEDFVVITFTEAATQELRDRISETLRARCDELTGEAKEKISRKLSQISLMNISTIHSFCKKILDENAFEAGFSVDADIVKGNDEKRIFRTFVNKWLSAHSQDVKGFQEKFGNEWYGILMSAFESICQEPGRMEIAKFDAENQANALSTAQSPAPNDDDEKEDNFITVAENIEFFKYVNRMREAYQGERSRDAMHITQEELLTRACALVKKDSGVREYLRKNIKHIHVDEFQDTNPVQTELIWMIASKDDTYETLRDDCLMVVGDPKQSIYLFRGAQVKLFTRTKERMSKLSNAKIIELQWNFRSHPKIIEWVNNVYGGNDPMIPDYKNMMFPETKNPDASYPAELCGAFRIPVTEECPKPKTAAEDAERVAALIEALIKKYELRFEDFLILTKNTIDCEEYIKALKDKSIPVRVRGNLSKIIDDDKLFTAFIHTLRGLSDTTNPLFEAEANANVHGLDISSYETEYVRAMSGKVREYLKETGFYDLKAEAKIRFIIDNLRTFLPLESLSYTERELQDFKVNLMQAADAILAENPGNFASIADAFIDYTKRDLKKQNSLTRETNAVRLMNVHQAKGLEGKIVIIAHRKGDGVKTDTEKLGIYRESDGTVDGSCFYPVLSIPKGLGTKNYPTYAEDPDIVEKAKQENEDEGIRLEYVAVTRAGNTLFIMSPIAKKEKKDESSDVNAVGGPKEKEDTWMKGEKYDENLPDDGFQTLGIDLGAVNAGGAVSGVSSQVATKNPANANRLTDEELSELLKESETGNDSSGSMISVTPSGMEDNNQSSGYRREEPGFRLETGRPAGRIFGIIMHRVFELMINRRQSWFGKDACEGVLRLCVEEALCDIEDSAEAKNDKDVDVDKFRKYLNERLLPYFKTGGVIHELVEKYSDAEFYTEYPFSFISDVDFAAAPDYNDIYERIRTNEGESITGMNDAGHHKFWVNGTADLVIVYREAVEKKVLICDYKSDRRNGCPIPEFRKRRDEKYKLQLKLYKLAIAKNMGLEPEEIKTKLIDLYENEDAASEFGSNPGMLHALRGAFGIE